jgi:hypothetical protein
MTFEVRSKKDNTVSFIDGITNMFPLDVTNNSDFKTWRNSVAITKNIFETNNHIVTLKS